MKIFWHVAATHKSPQKDEVEKFLAESLGDYLMSEGSPVVICETLDGIIERAKGGKLPELIRGEHGKPSFAGESLRGVHFSLSHTSGAAAAIFSDREVGIDIERLGRFDAADRGAVVRADFAETNARVDGETDSESESRLLSIAERVFADDEREYLTQVFGRLRARRFLAIWTAKEAYMKWTGRGFAEGSKTFSVFDKESVLRTFRGPSDIICGTCFLGDADEK